MNTATVVRTCLAAALASIVALPVLAQESRSAALVKQLAAALDAAKLDSIAARDPSTPGVYVGVLYFPGLQLLAVAAQYTAPALLDARLAKHEYRDVYVDLNSAGTPGTRIFVTDLGADGLQADAGNDQPSDGYEAGGKRTAFDGEWRPQQLSEGDYAKVFSAADERYSQMLAALLAELKKSS